MDPLGEPLKEPLNESEKECWNLQKSTAAKEVFSKNAFISVGAEPGSKRRSGVQGLGFCFRVSFFELLWCKRFSERKLF